MGFVNPTGLLSGALFAVLLAVYLFERVRRRVEVPSLLLWQAVGEDPLERQRLRPDLLLALQVLLLLALVLGFSRPFLQGEPVALAPDRHVLVIDTSASMQAREGKHTRLREARGKAAAFVRALPPEDEAMVLAAAAQPELVTAFTHDRAALIRAVGSLKATDTGTNLSAAAALAQRVRVREPERTEIVLFTDLPLTALEPAMRTHVRLFRAGTTGDNVAISSLQVFQGPFEEPRQARAFAVVRNFSARERHGVISFSVAGNVVKQTGFTIPARATRTFRAERFARGGLLATAIEIDDALRADNRAYGWIREHRDLQVVLVSPASPLLAELRAIARALPGFQVRHVSPQRYAADGLAAADVVIFHRVAPESPAHNALYVYPPAGNSVFPVVGHARDVEVIDWSRNHKSIADLEPLLATPLHSAAVVERPPGSTTLVWSRNETGEFPLVFAGTHGGHRRACITFDLEVEGLRNNDNVPLLLLFLNLIDWLAAGDLSPPATLRTGDLYELDPLFPALPVHVVDPRGRVTDLPPTAHALAVDFAGVYELSSGGSRHLVVANFFDPEESDIGRSPDVPTPPESPPSAPPRKRRTTEFGWWLYLAAAALMAVEWAAWRVRP